MYCVFRTLIKLVAKRIILKITRDFKGGTLGGSEISNWKISI